MPIFQPVTTKPVDEYELPAATADTLGGIKVGNGLSVAADGTLSADAQAATTVVADRAAALALTPEVGALYFVEGENQLYCYGADALFRPLDMGADWFGQSGGMTVVSWGSGTDEEIAAMVAAADAGKIDLADYWAVGDTRTVALSAMAATGVGESHAAQSVELTLMNAGGKTLASATAGGRTECSFVVGLKNCLKEEGYMNSTHTNTDGWYGCARRTWCNDVFRAAVPATLRGCFKQFLVYTGQYSGSVTTTADYFALPAEYEVFGSESYAAGAESGNLSQFTWYKTSANRIKTVSGAADSWWERSPSSVGSSYFCYVYSDGSARYGYAASSAYGLAPFGCI